MSDFIMSAVKTSLFSLSLLILVPCAVANLTTYALNFLHILPCLITAAAQTGTLQSDLSELCNLNQESLKQHPFYNDNTCDCDDG